MNMLKGQSLTCCTMLCNNASPNFVVHITRASKHSKILGLLKMCVEHETVYFYIFIFKVIKLTKSIKSPCLLVSWQIPLAFVYVYILYKFKCRSRCFKPSKASATAIRSKITKQNTVDMRFCIIFHFSCIIFHSYCINFLLYSIKR